MNQYGYCSDLKEPAGISGGPVRKRRQTYRTLMHLNEDMKCSVCKNPAGPHIYYGAKACLPCRAFFKRSVDQHQEYICFGDNNCEISYSGRRACKHCRYKACLRGGMKVSYVLLNEETKSKPKLSNKKELLTQEEAQNIQHLAGISRIFDKSKIGQLANWKIILQEMIRFLRKLPFFQNLPDCDKEIILQKNVSLAVLFQKCTFFNPNFNLFVQLSALLGQKEVDKLQRKLKDYGICQRQLAGNTFTFADLFFVPEASPEDTDRFIKTQSQISYWPRDCYEYVLLLLIILFEPRYMKKPETVYRMQTYFSELLFKYLLTTSAAEEGKPKALARFGSGIDCISKCVELNDLFTRTNNSDENLFDIILAEL